MLWDMGQKVGHATRSVDECLRQARADMTIRTAILEARLICGETSLHDELSARFDAELRQGIRPRIHRRQARRARRPPPQGRRHALSRRAERQGGQGRAARPEHALLDRQVPLPRPLVGGAGRPRRPVEEGVHASAKRPRTSSGRCAARCISWPARPRNGSPSTSSARSRRASAIRTIRACRRSSAS